MSEIESQAEPSSLTLQGWGSFDVHSQEKIKEAQLKELWTDEHDNCGLNKSSF